MTRDCLIHPLRGVGGLSAFWMVTCLLAVSGIAQPASTLLRAAPGDREVRLEWEAATGVAGYRVKQATTPAGPAMVIASNLTQTSLMVTNLRNGTAYYFTLSSAAGDFESGDAPRLKVTPSGPFLDVLPAGAKLEKLAAGFQYTEGPLWVPADGGYLIFCDVYGNRLLRWAPGAEVTTFRKPSHQAGGNMLDLQGRLLTTEHTSRRVVRAEWDGTITPLVTQYNGRPFNEPNDLAVKSDGTVWFSDPTYANSQTQPGQWVYRFDADQGNASVTLVAKDTASANGICFSPDEARLYVADYSAGVRVYDVLPEGTLTSSGWFTRLTPADGLKTDRTGRLWVSAQANGLRVFEADKTLAGTLPIPEAVANLCFGGANQEMLFVTAASSLYGITRLPDLILSAVSPSPAAPTVNQPVWFSATVKNQGTGAIPPGTPIRVAFSIGGATNVLRSGALSAGLPPDASVVLTSDGGVAGSAWLAREGATTIYATVDDRADIKESREDNNTFRHSLNVGGVPADADGDSLSNLDETTASTDPQDAQSVLRVHSLELLDPGRIRLTWPSVPGKRYRVVARTRLLAPEWIGLTADIVATESTTSWSGIAPSLGGPAFFQVAVFP